ncbi:DBH [Mytilus edulis]|uniref:DBH n=1 Tax=Mytilus edulis TaxID=6550 RepID=A0A8S3PUJ5_MYTED|nr:DBH [Mytilus edulis]
MDSDGDGMTNGYELGDPNCVWAAGEEMTPTRDTDITIPECVILSMLQNAIKQIQTSQYHVHQTLLTVMQHKILVSEYLTSETISLLGKMYGNPTRRWNAHRTKRLDALALHWTNPLLSNSLNDGSGMKLYFTPNLRPNDAGIFITGQNYLNIPSGLESHQEEGECPADCTNQLFTGNLHVFSALNHMHYLGSEMKVELHRNGAKIADLTDDPLYVYDSPQLHELSPAIEVMPGDSIATKCTYKSTSRSGTTLYGQSTFDEMCFGLLYYYPVANIAGAWTCISFKGISQCEIDSGNVDGCNIFDFFNFGNPVSKDSKNNGWYTADAFHTAMLTHNRCFKFYDLSVEQNQQFYNSIVDNCEPWGSCLEQCDTAIDAQMNQACMRPGTYEHFRSYAVINQNIQWIRFFASVASCRII